MWIYYLIVLAGYGLGAIAFLIATVIVVVSIRLKAIENIEMKQRMERRTVEDKANSQSRFR